jgi:hypothetical protein
MVLDPRACETQLIGQLHEDLTEEGAVFSRALHDPSRNIISLDF